MNLITVSASDKMDPSKVVIATLLLIISCMAAETSGKTPPNFVLFIADDVGMGDLGMFGNTTIRSPNIDSIASQGARLSHHLTAASVCTPSRAAFLTGRYPVRMGLVPTNQVRVNMFVSSISGLPANETTIAELLKDQGYTTGLIGKWHLGVHCSNTWDFCHHPLKQGFDYFYGLPLTNLKDFGSSGDSVVTTRIPHMDLMLISIAFAGLSVGLYLFKHGWGIGVYGTLLFVTSMGPLLAYLVYTNLAMLNAVLVRNYDVIEQPLQLNNNLSQRLVKEGVHFLQQRQDDQKPFLLVMSWIHAHTALHTSADFSGRSKHGQYGDVLEELDWSVGQILDALDHAGAKNNTFVYFSSDNGGHSDERDLAGQVTGGYNGIFRGGKTQGGQDGGIRVPTAAMLPGVIPAGLELSQPTSQMDIFSTVADLAGVPVPKDRKIDSKSLVPQLSGEKSKVPPHEFLFHYCGEDIHAARYSPSGSDDVWKVHFATAIWKPGTEGCGYICDCYGDAITWHDPPIMYNIGKDPSERQRLDTTLPLHAIILKKIEKAVEEHRSSISVVPDQYAVLSLMPRPWLQPCCSYPTCTCVEPF